MRSTLVFYHKYLNYIVFIGGVIFYDIRKTYFMADTSSAIRQLFMRVTGVLPLSSLLCSLIKIIIFIDLQVVSRKDEPWLITKIYPASIFDSAAPHHPPLHKEGTPTTYVLLIWTNVWRVWELPAFDTRVLVKPCHRSSQWDLPTIRQSNSLSNRCRQTMRRHLTYSGTSVNCEDCG